MPNIVQVNVQVTSAPAPATLQQSGALVSVGGTTLTPGTSSLLTQLSDLTALLRAPAALTSITWSGGVATVTTTSPHGLTVSDVKAITIADETPAGYNGTYQCTVTGASTFTYALASNPGAQSVAGTWVPADVAVVVAMATTYFAQGANVAVSVLELGPLGPTLAVAALGAYLALYPNTAYVAGAQGYFYSYLVPRSWDGNAAFLTLIANYEASNAKTYFFVTTTLQNYALYTKTMKCVLALVEAPAYGVWGANVITASSYSSGQLTFTTTSAHGVAVGQWFQVSGELPVAYNGWFQAAIGTTGSTLVANVSANPGASTQQGTLLASVYASAGVSATEFSLAADFEHTLGYNPSSTNRVTPNAFSFLAGVTAFPTRGNNALLTALKAANINYVGTANEGGISTSIMAWGATVDGNDFQVWYSIDWVQINGDLVISNEVINGSNQAANPLYYNQQGINRLQARLAALVAQGVSFGLVFGPPAQTELAPADLQTAINAGTFAGSSIVNAVSFLVYATANPSDYQARTYKGLTLVYTPQVGFIQIVFNVNVNFFPSQV